MTIRAILSALLLAGTAISLPSGDAYAASTNVINHNSGPMDHNGSMNHSSGGMGHGRDNANPVMMPALPGQDAFGAIQEILALLNADPATDWSRVDINGLREHLVDMDLLITATQASETVIEGGLEISVTAKGRALQAVQRMLPAHAPTIDGLSGWEVSATLTDTGGKLTVTAADAKETARIRGLGFYGVMATGNHHQAHHYRMARGQKVHAH